MPMKHFCLVLMMTALCFTPAMAEVVVSDAKLILGIGKRPGVAHAKLTNHSDSDVTLTRVASRSFGRIEMHTHDMQGGIMKMRQVDGFTIGAGETLILKRGGKHLMLFDPQTAADTEGEKAPVTLSFHFDDASTTQIEVMARMRDMPPRHSDEHHKHDHHKHGHDKHEHHNKGHHGHH